MNDMTDGFARKRIAVIGAGISGMGAAHMLAPGHQVVLFEAEDRLGGHARTRMAGPNRDQAVDTGFIVFNYPNYPCVAALFRDLDVVVVPSNMSFGASLGGGRMEYGLASLGVLFAQRRNIANPRFLRMVSDILRFNSRALAASRETGLTIRGLMDKLKMGEYFRTHYLLPLSGAIWSTPTDKVLDFPAHAMMRFFENHGLLGLTGQHQWYTVDGGSAQYVDKLGTAMRHGGVQVRLGTPVQAVRRDAAGASVKVPGAGWETFDEVVFATHSDVTLRLLSDASSWETETLGAICYQPNTVILHSDTSVMPRARSVWSSWVYAEEAIRTDTRIDLTYWMNSLQPWLTRDQFFVTLNTARPIREDLIWDQTVLHHPVYDLAALDAQTRVAARNGQNRTWFCGAWMKSGFHEDGLSSAVDVARALHARSALSIAAE